MIQTCQCKPRGQTPGCQDQVRAAGRESGLRPEVCIVSVAMGSGAGLLGFTSPQPCLERGHPGRYASLPVSVKWDDTVPDPRVCEALATEGLVREMLYLCRHLGFRPSGHFVGLLCFLLF